MIVFDKINSLLIGNNIFFQESLVEPVVFDCKIETGELRVHLETFDIPPNDSFPDNVGECSCPSECNKT